MRVLYGVVGEGMGHAMRSRVLLEHLVAHDHDVTIMTSGRAVDFLGKRFDGVRKIHGLHLIYEENRVRRGKTFWSNVLAGTVGIPKNIAAYFDLLTSFRPEVVISDFESWTYLYAKTHGLPIVSVDNMQIINRCRHDDAILAGHEADFQVARGFVKGKLPFCDEYFVTTFFRPEIRKERTRLFRPSSGPRSKRREPRAKRGDHLLVYQTAEGHDELAGILARTARVPHLRDAAPDPGRAGRGEPPLPSLQ